jgi:hypothetical protein
MSTNWTKQKLIRLFLCQAISLIFASTLIADEKAASKSEADGYADFSYEIRAFKNDGIQFVNAHLPPASIGRMARIAVTIRNMTENPLTLESVKVGCECTKAEIPSLTLKSEEFTRGTIVLPLDAMLSKATGFDLECKGDVGRINVSFFCDVMSAAVFKNPSVAIDIPPKSSVTTKPLSVRVPLTVSPDVSKDDLRVEFSKELNIKKYEFQVGEKSHELQFELDPDSVREIAQGEITLVNRLVDQKSTLICYLRHRDTLEIFPKQIRFSRSENESNSMEAVAMARFAIDASIVGQSPDQTLNEKSDPGQTVTKADDIDFELVASEGLTLTSKPLGRGVYRLVFRYVSKSGSTESLPKDATVVASLGNITVEQQVSFEW